ncbi:trophozoite exported protein 1-like [Plodia interpunctella]|uniref:trophozoite exported protein 1-like n=1 Tax=Plodia interpunctella TaxID=58824 RepID=UPI0023677F31|nr:RING finger protein PFF0165c-like [Plodia interpunctella]
MDGSTLEHSDSDSGESWTLLEASPAIADELPETLENAPETSPAAGDATDSNCERDDDTDGISIISDSEPESPFPCEANSHRCLLEEDRPDQQKCQFIPTSQVSPNNLDQHESMRSEDDFLGDSSGKNRTYVHRRNKRLSMVLNIIVLGSVITAAGVAIGHMWGAKNECNYQTAPSVNKILSNLYKLQEENAYLRSKLKELTLINNLQVQQKRAGSDKMYSKQNKCKKVFEASLNNKNVEKYTKCVDVNENNSKTNSHLAQPEFEKEFLADVNRLKLVYEQNKSWLDEEITKRLNHEKQLINKNKHNVKEKVEKILRDNLETPLETITELPNIETNISELPSTGNINVLSEPDLIDILPATKVSYADSLQSNTNKNKKNVKQNVSKYDENEIKDRAQKRKIKRSIDTIPDQYLSEEEIKKDDRYTGHKYKQEKKKNDRQKSHKKQKRKNKYEQWEMKGGYMKDYDDFSITSQDPEVVYISIDKNKLDDNVEGDNISKLSGIQENLKSTSTDVHTSTEKVPEKRVRSTNWYDNRAVLRMEARKRLQTELFGDVSPNTAGWYFRRMRRREQCRAKNDNSTHRKFPKRNMNFKTKH